MPIEGVKKILRKEKTVLNMERISEDKYDIEKIILICGQNLIINKKGEATDLKESDVIPNGSIMYTPLQKK